MLEDDFTYVIRKAFKGLALSPSEAALRAGLPEMDVLAFSRGKFSATTARSLAPVLGLDPEALATHDHYEPSPPDIESVRRLKLPFGEDHVNAWLISNGGAHLLFDTGDDRTSAASHLEKIGVNRLDAIFITHGDHDHYAGLSTLKQRAVKSYGAKISGAEEIGSDQSFQFGEISLRTIDLAGHADPAIGYLIEGLEKPILIPGDAIFAGSIGGCPSPERYQIALKKIRAALENLSDETLILPGHGPATTLGEERQRNPFFGVR